MGPAFYRNAECCALVFDLTDPKSFETIENWRSEFLRHLNPTDPDSFPFVLIGNKCDKESERKVLESRIRQYCASNNDMPYFETSAKENINVEKAFEEVASLAFKREQKNPEM
jgi:Ras-related protein Rab-7A